MPSFLTKSEEETIALGRTLAASLAPGAVLLIGELGAGKTTLAKGIVEGWTGVNADEVSSPTFTLIHEYDGNRGMAYHIDLYRLDEPREVEALGIGDLFASGALVLLEWAERFPSLLPPERTEIRLRPADGASRRITVAQASPPSL